MLRRIFFSIFLTTSAFADTQLQLAMNTRNFTHSIKTINIQIDEGDINIKGHESPNQVVVQAHPISHDCRDQVDVQGDRLVVLNKKERGGCKCAYELSVPWSASIQVNAGSSNVSVKDMVGSFEVETGQGNVSTEGALKQVSAKLGAGQAQLKGVIGDTTVKVGAGNIDITYGPLSGQPHSVVASSGMGAAQLTLPATAKVKYGKSSASGFTGKFHSDFPSTDNNYDLDVKISSGMGDTTIAKSVSLKSID